MTRKAGLSLLRFLIGIGFTFSLVGGVTLTMLTLFTGTGNNLVWSRSGPDWGWGGGAAIAWALTLFWWLCWRCLPAAKPTRLFPALEDSLHKSSSLTSLFMSVIGMLCGLYLMLGAGLSLAVHAAGSSWLQHAYYALLTAFNGGWTVSVLRQRKAKR